MLIRLKLGECLIIFPTPFFHLLMIYSLKFQFQFVFGLRTLESSALEPLKFAVS